MANYWMVKQEPTAYSWDDFVKDLKDRVLAPGEEKTLVELSGDEKNKTFVSFRDEVRTALAPLTVKVYYKGIYDKKDRIFQKSLDWFGRNLK